MLLRSVLAPPTLLAATILSALAALGLGGWASMHVFGFPALDNSTPLFAFLFLVALGVDYTIFLVTRAREEAPRHGARDGMVRAVSATGGVITSAGIVLAAVFCVLGVLPLIVLTQLGIIVGLGILLDTFVVRTLVIPALFALIGDRSGGRQARRQPGMQSRAAICAATAALVDRGFELDPPRAGEVLLRWPPPGCATPTNTSGRASWPRPPNLARSASPTIGGHEGSGVVLEVGDGVTRLRPATMW